MWPAVRSAVLIVSATRRFQQHGYARTGGTVHLAYTGETQGAALMPFACRVRQAMHACDCMLPPKRLLDCANGREFLSLRGPVTYVHECPIAPCSASASFCPHYRVFGRQRSLLRPYDADRGRKPLFSIPAIDWSRRSPCLLQYAPSAMPCHATLPELCELQPSRNAPWRLAQ